MKIKEAYSILNNISPFELQESWDNSGLNIGDMDDEISQIILSLDIDLDLINKLSKNTLLITHHPLIFHPLNQIDKSFPSKIIRKMIKKNISLIAMHTNFDKTHLNKYVLKNILKFTQIKQDGFISYANIDMSFSDLIVDVTKKLNLGYTKTINAKKHIKRIALTTGSGASLIKQIKADCFLTGDIKYHDAMMAKEIGLCMIDIGHFESEIYFADILKKILDSKKIKSQIINSSLPFTYKKPKPKK